MDKALMRAQVGRCIVHAGDGYTWKEGDSGNGIAFTALAEEVALEMPDMETQGYDMGTRLHIERSDFPAGLPKANDSIEGDDGQWLRVVRAEEPTGYLKASILCVPRANTL